MRINIYQEEILYDWELVWVEPREGKRFCGVRFYMKSHDDLHHEPGDDDRTSVTFWLNNPMAAEKFFKQVVQFITDHSQDDPEPLAKKTYRADPNWKGNNA